MLTGGQKFRDFVEFKQALLSQKERFYRALVEKLFTYALGRVVEPADRTAIDDIVAQMQSGDPTLRTIVQGIAASDAFGRK